MKEFDSCCERLFYERRVKNKSKKITLFLISTTCETDDDHLDLKGSFVGNDNYKKPLVDLNQTDSRLKTSLGTG